MLDGTHLSKNTNNQPHSLLVIVVIVVDVIDIVVVFLAVDAIRSDDINDTFDDEIDVVLRNSLQDLVVIIF